MKNEITNSSKTVRRITLENASEISDAIKAAARSGAYGTIHPDATIEVVLDLDEESALITATHTADDTSQAT